MHLDGFKFLYSEFLKRRKAPREDEIPSEAITIIDCEKEEGEG